MATKYPLITYIAPNGDTASFEDMPMGEPIKGLGNSSPNYEQIKTPYQHGTSVVSGVAGERIISIETLISKDHEVSLRDKILWLNAVLNPFHDKSGRVTPGVLRYQACGDDPVYEIPALPYGHVDIKKTGPGWSARVYDFLCPNPFFRQLPVQVVSGAIEESGFNIPWAVPTSITTGTTSVELWNFGNVPSPTQIEITGPASDIWIQHRETGALMRIFISLTADDKLVIDGETRTVKVGDVNAAGTLSTDSIYIDCMEGQNTFDVACDEGTPTVTIRSYSLVTGVN